MKLNRLPLFLLPVILGGVYLTTTSSSGGISSAASGCFCHGNSSSATTVIVSAPVTGYTNNQIINFTVTVSNASRPAAGFNLETNIGTIISGGAGTQVLSANEITHSSPKSMVAGTATWTFQWQAPASGNGTLTLNLSGNAVNLADGSVGDLWNTGNTLDIPFSTALDVANPTPLHFAQSDNGVLVSWLYDSKDLIQEYRLQRSTDGKHFETIFVQEVNQTTNADLQFEDIQKSTSNFVYYRLETLDQEGKKHLSAAQMFRLNTENPIQLYPTLIDQNRIYFNGLSNEQHQLVLIDMLGNTVYQHQIQNGVNTLPEINKGHYAAIIRTSNQIIYRTFIQVQ
ncbi:MAG: hypothetical protein KBF25_01450 [Chitinophagaceae bacterium]|jgi:hypothetical protein|nr:hypothetical protein [Chitinophagaceae bacterium]